MATTTFAIGGMHCAACAVRNERTLGKIPGVLKANVNLGTRRARIEFDESAVTDAVLRDAVVQSGYEVLADDLAADPQQLTRLEVRDREAKSASGRLRSAHPLCSWRWRMFRCRGPISDAMSASGYRRFSAVLLFSASVSNSIAA